MRSLTWSVCWILPSLLIGTALASDDAADPKITIVAPEIKKSEDPKSKTPEVFEVQSRTNLPCRIRAEFKEIGHDQDVMIVFYIGDKQVMAGAYVLKTKRISDKVFEYEGDTRTPAAGTYYLKAVLHPASRNSDDYEREPSTEIKSKPGKPDPSELAVDVKRAP